jgi:hypothetical protein
MRTAVHDRYRSVRQRSRGAARHEAFFERRRGKLIYLGDVALILLKIMHSDMKKNTQILKTRPKLSLGDLILAVSSCTKNTKETVAAVADLLGSGQVRVENNGRYTKARVC